MNIKKIFELQLSNLLEKYRAKNEPLAKSGFFLFEDFEENELLFIGINPSDVTGYNVPLTNGIYWGSETFMNAHPYYKPFPSLSNGKWSHLDLFFTLEKDQSKIKEAIEAENLFLGEQIEISTAIIHKLEPTIIVVCNAFASGLIKDVFQCNFDDTIGTYRIKDFINIPIFFSGMITGQRSLDVGSRERLKWHIGFVKEALGQEIHTDKKL